MTSIKDAFTSIKIQSHKHYTMLVNSSCLVQKLVQELTNYPWAFFNIISPAVSICFFLMMSNIKGKYTPESLASSLVELR